MEAKSFMACCHQSSPVAAPFLTTPRQRGGIPGAGERSRGQSVLAARHRSQGRVEDAVTRLLDERRSPCAGLSASGTDTARPVIATWPAAIWQSVGLPAYPLRALLMARRSYGRAVRISSRP